MLRTISVVVLLVAVLYEVCKWPNNIVSEIAAVWDTEIELPANGPRKILVGVNANLDMVVSAVKLLRALEVNSTSPCDHASLSSVGELEQVVGFSMLHCAGVERTFIHHHLFNNIVNTASSVPHSFYIGGNAALIAQKIKSTFPSLEVMLIGPIGNQLRKLLHGGILTPDVLSHGSKDEIHMILEYSAGNQWGEVKSFCANRVIFSHDISNSNMVALEQVEESVAKFMPDLAILSGAHLLGDQTQEVWEQRLNHTATILETVLRSIPVHWELATIGNLNFFQHLADSLFPRIQSLGLNEQELLSVAKSCGAPFDFEKIPQKPDIELVSDLLHWLMLQYSSITGHSSTLSRVHLHSLMFHVIAVVQGGPWHNSKQAVMAGARVAGLQACDATAFNAFDFKLLNPEQFYVSRENIPLSEKVMYSKDGCIQWFRSGIHYYLSPVLVCNNPAKTVGLGDAISALGLIYSEFKS